MRAFEYAAPRDEAQVVDLLSSEWGQTEVLAGGTDLIGLMKKLIVTPARVVNIKEVASLRGIEADSQGVRIGATTNLDDLLDSPELDPYPAVKQAIRGINSPQVQAQGTIGGELCHRPRCWYFRNGQGLLAGGGRMVSQGDNRYHAIFANSGPAKFVNASRVAPALIALDARLRIIGPEPDEETMLPLEFFYRAPRAENQRENILQPKQLLTHIMLPPADDALCATYEIRHGEGADAPLAAASAALRVSGGVVTEARIVLGQVAPTPWVSREAADALVGRVLTPDLAREAGDAAVLSATPLSNNGYKVQLARVAVQRAILLAAGWETGGF
jgi:xanthine dehydrogenase YagS FAD-binding subunit